MPPEETTDLLRTQLGRARSGLCEHERTAAAASAADRAVKLRQYLNARRVAGFFGSKGELDPMPLLHSAAYAGRECYLPVLHPFKSGCLWFCRWIPGEPLRLNRYGIPEPSTPSRHVIAARHLDLVIVPLLGFDTAGHRIGMGGGYYDRTLSFKRYRSVIRKPYLLGFAHEVQRVENIAPAPWDVTLDAIVTNEALYLV